MAAFSTPSYASEASRLLGAVERARLLSKEHATTVLREALRSAFINGAFEATKQELAERYQHDDGSQPCPTREKSS